MPPVMDVVAKGCDQLTEFFDPLKVGVDSVLVILDNGKLPGNIRYKTAHENSRIVIAPFGCEQAGWWQRDHVWEQLINELFHETVHAALSRKLPAKAPTWLTEGIACYVAHRVDAALGERIGMPAPPGASESRFLAAPAEDLKGPFRRVQPIGTSLEETLDMYEAYDLYLGAFLASERAGESVFRSLVRIMGSEKKLRSELLRDLDPFRLHQSIQQHREQIIADAKREIAEVGDSSAWATLGWLGICVAAEPPQGDTCQELDVSLAPYYGACLSEEKLAAKIRQTLSCGNLIRPGWGSMIERYCARFPETSFLDELHDAALVEVQRSVKRCKRD